MAIKRLAKRLNKQQTKITPLLKTLAWHGINIIEIVSSFNEITIILEDSFVNQAFSVLKNP